MQPFSSSIIDQAVHGYDRGHKLLVSTIELDDLSRSKMLVLSDLLTEVTLQEGVSYITGYPLRSASRYVLARTWSAGPEFRPGSVWTHSLIIDFQTIALTSDPAAFASLFQMPTASTLGEFTRPIEFERTSLADFQVENSPRAALALTQLYGDFSRQVISIPAIDPDHDENLVLAIWRQMWPALRRDFAFTTSVSTVESEFDAECFLRFVGLGYGDYAGLSITRENISIGHRILLDDLAENGTTKLRAFLARYAIESTRPRYITARMAALYEDMQGAHTALLLSDITELLKEEKLPRFAKDIFAHTLETAKNLDDLLMLLKSFKEDVADVNLRNVVNMVREFSVTDLKELLNATQPSKRGSFGDRLFKAIVEFGSLNKLAGAADIVTRKKMYLLRPELIAIQEFWPSGDQERVDLIEMLESQLTIDLDQGLRLFGDTVGAKTLAKLLEATKRLSSGSSASLLVSERKKSRELYAAWLADHIDQLEDLIGHLSEPSTEMLDALAKIYVETMQPVRNLKAWSELVLSVEGKLASTVPAILVVTYAVAVHLSTANAMRAAKAVYDHLQTAARDMALGYGAERYLKKVLSSFGSSWSTSALITKAAVKTWPLHYGDTGALHLSSEPMYLFDIAAEVAQTSGRRTLEDAMKDPNISFEASQCIRLFVEKEKQKTLLKWWW